MKQHGSNAEYLLGFLATHECFSLFFLHMPMALQKVIVLFGEFLPGEKGWPTLGSRFGNNHGCGAHHVLEYAFSHLVHPLSEGNLAVMCGTRKCLELT